MIGTKFCLGSLVAFGLMAGAATQSSAQTDLPVYIDALQNGFEDWSWATVDVANAAPAHSGAASIKVTAKAWEAFRVHATAPIATASYASLTFWVNGGAAGGQPLSLQATVNGNAQTGVDLGTAAANSWKQYTISMAALGLAGQANFDGFWIQNNSANDLSASPFYIDDITLVAAAAGGGGGGGAAGLSLTTVVSDNGLSARSVQWTDAAGQPRKAIMVDQRPEGAGYLRQLTYKVNGADRVCTGTGDNGHQGDGYVQNHTATGGDNSSHATPGTTTVALAGAHHAIISYNMPTYQIDGQTVPTTIQWFFADGRTHPIFAISQDARATAGNLGADTRSPYGDVAYDGGMGATVGGASFGDTYKFATLASAPEQVTRASGWRYDEANTIPYAMQWTDPAQVDAEMGHVATLPISVQDQGSDSRTSPIVDNRGKQAPNGPMIDDENWAYQVLNYVMPDNGPTGSKRLTWGSNWGYPGGFDNWGSKDAQNNPLSPREYSQHSTNPQGQALGGARADGMLSAYSVFVVLGTHSGGYKGGTVGQMVSQMENAARASLSAVVGGVRTSGAAGVGNASSATITYTPAGYNPIFSTWEVMASGNAVDATLTPAAGTSLDHPMFVVNGYTLGQLPGSISVGAGLSTPDVDYFATLDAANQRLWITVNRSINAPMNLVVTAAAAPPQPPVINAIPASAAVGSSVIITGNNFSGATAVKFNGTSANFTVDSPTQITAVVPAGATTGPISVTTPGGTASSATNFSPAVAPPGVVHLNLDANLAVRTADARWFGVNEATWDANLGAPETVSLLNEMGCQILRYPGGAQSDDYHWDANHADTTTFASVTAGAGAQAVLTVNYGSGTPEEAAAWVQFCNVNNHYGFKYWEIGNENYGFWEKDNNANPHDPYSYAVRAKDYIQQMKAIDPTIKIGVPVVTGEDTPSWDNYKDHPAINALTGQTHFGWTPVMLATLKSLGVTPDFLDYHRYPEDTEAGQPSPDDDATLLQSASGWANDAADLRTQITGYFGAGGESIELLCTENNSDSGLQGKQSTSLVNGLYYADSLGQLMLTEFNGFLWWNFRNGSENDGSFDPGLYGWRDYGDFGMVNGLNTRHPTFYAAKLMHQFASAGDTIVRVTSDNPLVAAYAAKRSNGALSLVVINKDLNNNSLNAQITLSGFVPQSAATVLSYGIVQDNAARDGAPAQSQDIATSSFNGAAASFSYTVPPLSLTLLTLAPVSAPLPVIAMIPTSATVGASIVITGNNFTGATAVMFNGVSALFTVDSATQITAVVPAGATPGPISVTTPAGTAASASNFSPVTAAPPPTLVVRPSVTSSGLRVVSGPDLYDRQNIATDTTTNDYGWVGSAGPVTYSLTISDFPPQGYVGFQAHMFLVPNSTGLTAPDYDEPSVVMMDIQAHADGSTTAWLRYKISQPSDNSFLYAAGTLGQVNCATGPLGAWSASFANGTAITLKAPDGSTTQLSFPDPALVAAAFGGKVTVYFGNQANDASQVGQSTTFSRIQISGTPRAAAIDETFPGPDLNQHPASVSWQWLKLAEAPAGISIAATSGLMLSWGLPDTGYTLRSSPSLSAPAWTDVSLADAVTSSSSKTLFIPNQALPNQTSGFFRLVKAP